MLVARPRLVAIGTGVALAAALSSAVLGSPATAPERARSRAPRTYLIHLIDGGDPIVVQKYTEEGGEIRFEKYGGWVSIPSSEVLRIVPDDSEEALPILAPRPAPPADADAAILAPPTQPADSRAPLYVATRSGATVRASDVGAAGRAVRVTTPEGSLTFHRADLVGVLRVPTPPALPEAWITLWGAEDGRSEATSQPAPGPESRPSQPAPEPESRPKPSLPAMSDRPHRLELTSGVVIQVDGFWVEAGEIRFRRLGGVVGFALGEIARLLPQEVASVRGRLPARFVRRLGPDRVEVRLPEGLKGIRLIGIEPVGPESPSAGDDGSEDPWAALDGGLLVHLEFDRERSGPDGDWLAYVYLPNGRMLNAELIRVGLARPRNDGRNLRYLDLFEEVFRREGPRPAAP